jgi:hypothetical protein
MFSRRKFCFSISTICLLLSIVQYTHACANERTYSFWFGTVITCTTSDYYSLDMAKMRCPAGQVLGEVMDAYLYTNITYELSISTNDEVRKYSIWINGNYNSIPNIYIWPSNGEPITQFPKTYTYVYDHSTTYRRTTPLWIMNIPAYSNSYLSAVASNAAANSILCLNKELLQARSNPCSESNRVNNTYWFGTLISCKRDVYSINFARDHCPTGQVLGEIMDAYLYTNITKEISMRTENEAWKYTIWVNGKYNSIKGFYVWPSNGEAIRQFPPTYSYVNDHSTTYGRTTPMWTLNVPNSNSFLNAVVSETLANSFLCMNTDLLKLRSNPCSTTDKVNNTYWFGTLISCKRDVYSIDFAINHCPAGQKLAEISDNTLYLKISNEISTSLGNNLYTIWLNGKFDSIQNKYVWPSSGNPINEYPPSFNYVYDHSITYSRTTPLWRLDLTTPKSYLNAVQRSTLANSILCLNENMF